MPNRPVPAAAPGLPTPNRRGFLRGLTALPLIGGGVTLIGQPTAAAVPITGGTVASYLAWLNYEAKYVAWGAGARGYVPALNPGMNFHDFYRRPMELIAGEAIRRAPVILAAAGCPITDDEADATWTRLDPVNWREGVR